MTETLSLISVTKLWFLIFYGVICVLLQNIVLCAQNLQLLTQD